jgi:hypothetical protein
MVHQNNWWQLYSKLIQTIIIAFEYMIKIIIIKKDTCSDLHAKHLNEFLLQGKLWCLLINLSTMLLMHFFTGLLGWSVH